MNSRLMLLPTVALICGCASARDRLLGPKAANKAVSPNVKAVADRYNANSSQLTSIRCDDVTIDGKAKDPNGKSQIYTLNAQMAFEKPSNFRMKGYVIGRPEVDLGSNKNEIWCWVKRADPGAVYYCKREDLGRMQMAIPFQPDWLAEVLGVTELDPREWEWGGEKEDRYSIYSYQRTPTGERVIKQMVFDKKSDRLAAIRLYSASDRRKLANADVLEFYQDPKTGLQCPRKMKLDWPDAGTEMTVMLGRRSIEFNSVTPDDATALFTRGLADKEPINMADAAPRPPMPEPAPLQKSKSGYRTPDRVAERRTPVQDDDGIVGLGEPKAIGVRKASGEERE
jgi:hypothetical protein